MVYTAINLFWLFVWHYFANRHIGLSLREVLKGMAPYISVSLAVMAATWFATLSISDPLLSICAKILMASSLYLLLMWRLKSVVFRECMDYLFKKNKSISH